MITKNSGMWQNQESGGSALETSTTQAVTKVTYKVEDIASKEENWGEEKGATETTGGGWEKERDTSYGSVVEKE